jgi:hypothetical protein
MTERGETTGEAGEAMLEARFESRRACGRERQGGRAAKEPQFPNGKLGVLEGAGEIARAVLVVDGELLAGVDAVARMSGQLFPEGGSAGEVAISFGEQSEFAAGDVAKFAGEAGFEGALASRASALGMAPAMEEAREAEEVESLFGRSGGQITVSEKGSDLGEQGREASQVHPIVMSHGGKRLGGAAAEKVKVELWNYGGINIVVAPPAEARSVENRALEFDESDGAQAQLPEHAGGMEKVEVRGKPRRNDGAGECETRLEKGPVEGLSVEGDEDRALGKAGAELIEEGMLLGVVAHEKLLDLKAT